MRTEPSRRWTWTRIVLIASLGLNLAVVGTVSSLALRDPRPEVPAGFGMRDYANALPDPYRHDLGRALHESRADWRGPREALRAQRTALAAALTAELYDPAAVERILGAESRILAALADKGTALLLAQIARMHADTRHAYAEALMGARHRPGRDHP